MSHVKFIGTIFYPVKFDHFHQKLTEWQLHTLVESYYLY